MDFFTQTSHCPRYPCGACREVSSPSHAPLVPSSIFLQVPLLPLYPPPPASPQRSSWFLTIHPNLALPLSLREKGTLPWGPRGLYQTPLTSLTPLDQLLRSVNMLGFEGHAVSVTTTHLCHYSTNCHQCYVNTWTWLCSHNCLIILVSFFKGDGFIYPISDECLL